MCLEKIEGEMHPTNMLTNVLMLGSWVMQNLGWSSVVVATDVAVR